MVLVPGPAAHTVYVAGVPLEAIVATVVLLEVHVPPEGVAVKGHMEPTHLVVGGPVIVAPAVTVTTFDAKHPPVNVYLIVSMPGEAPNTSPLVPTVSTVAIDGCVLDHVPPVVGSVKVINDPTHTVAGVVGNIAGAPGVTFTVSCALHPSCVNVMIANPGTAPPVTKPDDVPTLAILVLALTHVPPTAAPPDVADNDTVFPVHIVGLWGDTTGVGFTVITWVIRPQVASKVMVEVPGKSPPIVASSPPADTDTIVATKVFELVQVPLPTVSNKLITAPWHT